MPALNVLLRQVFKDEDESNEVTIVEADTVEATKIDHCLFFVIKNGDKVMGLFPNEDVGGIYVADEDDERNNVGFTLVKNVGQD